MANLPDQLALCGGRPGNSGRSHYRPGEPSHLYPVSRDNS